MPKSIERRFLPQTTPIEVRESKGNAGVLVGYAAVFYRSTDPGTEFELWSDYLERIIPGAFDRAIREDDVRGLFNHSPDFLLGRTKAGTMRLSADDRGLRYEIDAPDTQAGRDVVASVKRGDLTGSSFSFLTTDEEWVKEDGKMIRQIRGVELFDVGPVTFPAYEATTADVRSEMRARAERAVAAPLEIAADLDLRRRRLDLAARA